MKIKAMSTPCFQNRFSLKRARFSERLTKVSKNENKEVVADMESVKAARELDSATRAYEQGYTQQAIDKIKGALNSVKRMNMSGYKSSSSMEQEEALNDALSEFESAPASPASESGKRMIKKYKEDSRAQQK